MDDDRLRAKLRQLVTAARRLPPIRILTVLAGGTSMMLVVSLILVEPAASLQVCWLALSMSGFWVTNRVLHGLRGAPGETESDGMIWLVPLAVGCAPVILFVVEAPFALRAIAVVIWTGAAIAAINLVRWEVPCPEWPHRLEYRDRSDLRGVLRSLFRSRLEPATSTSSGQVPRARRLSWSATIFYTLFGTTTVVVLYSDHVIDAIKSQVVAVTLLGIYAGFVVGFLERVARPIHRQVMETPSEKAGWCLQAEERQILVIVFGASSINVIVWSFIWFAIPIVNRLNELS